MLVRNFGNPHIQQEMQLLILVPTHLPKFNNYTYRNTRLNWKWQIGLIKSNNPHKKANNLYVDIIKNNSYILVTIEMSKLFCPRAIFKQ